jgi:hypothetical protein
VDITGTVINTIAHTSSCKAQLVGSCWE